MFIRNKKKGPKSLKRSGKVQYCQDVTMIVISLARSPEDSKNFSSKDISGHI